jgi:hypothetical protein
MAFGPVGCRIESALKAPWPPVSYPPGSAPFCWAFCPGLVHDHDFFLQAALSACFFAPGFAALSRSVRRKPLTSLSPWPSHRICHRLWRIPTWIGFMGEHYTFAPAMFFRLGHPDSPLLLFGMKAAEGLSVRSLTFQSTPRI